jgi:ABC-type transporter Mla maintaining outer membrane lipid asymmetry ATPase subunit MlaF
MSPPPPAPILACRDVGLSFGSVHALAGMTFDVHPGEFVSIIGPNGAGKTSIINTITGFYRPTRGTILFKGRDITGLAPHKVCRCGIARTFQNTELFAGLTVLENLLAARHIYLRSSLLSCAIYYGLAQREDIAAREVVEDIIDLLELEGIRKQEVATLPSHRGRGYAKSVVTRAVDVALAAGHEFVFLVADGDAWPKELYRRLGFEEGRPFVELAFPARKPFVGLPGLWQAQRSVQQPGVTEWVRLPSRS